MSVVGMIFTLQVPPTLGLPPSFFNCCFSGLQKVGTILKGGEGIGLWEIYCRDMYKKNKYPRTAMEVAATVEDPLYECVTLCTIVIREKQYQGVATGTYCKLHDRHDS